MEAFLGDCIHKPCLVQSRRVGEVGRNRTILSLTDKKTLTPSLSHIEHVSLAPWLTTSLALWCLKKCHCVLGIHLSSQQPFVSGPSPWKTGSPWPWLCEPHPNWRAMSIYLLRRDWMVCFLSLVTCLCRYPKTVLSCINLLTWWNRPVFACLCRY